MNKVLECLSNKKNHHLLLEIKDYLIKNHPDIDLKVFFGAPLILQLGVYLKFFESKNLYTLCTPNSYAIDFVNYNIDKVTNNKALDNLRKNNSPYEIARYDLNINDILVIHEMAILDMIILITKIPF
jgi:hypothetical protein